MKTVPLSSTIHPLEKHIRYVAGSFFALRREQVTCELMRDHPGMIGIGEKQIQHIAKTCGCMPDPYARWSQPGRVLIGAGACPFFDS